MEKVLGFIGSGNMGSAMIGGIIDAGIFKANNIIVSDIIEESLRKVGDKYGVRTTNNNLEVASEADIIILSIKPNIYPLIISQIKDSVKKDVIIVTIAAGKLIEDTEKQFGRNIKVVRVMPNTPALVREGMSALAPNKSVTEDDLKLVMDIFTSFGEAELVSEDLMDVVTAVSGSSPAYVYVFIEAMADAAVLDGLARDKAYKMAAQAVLGSARMVLETGMHPGLLKDMVTSPGGTTIEALAVLEEKGFRDSVISAMRACTKKSKALAE